MPLCKACSGITVETLGRRNLYHHLPDARALEVSAKNCPLCEVILLSRLEIFGGISLPAGPIRLYLDFPDDLRHENETTIWVKFPDRAISLDIFRESSNLLASSFDNRSTSRLMYTRPFFGHLGGQCS